MAVALAEFGQRVFLEGLDELVGELFRGEVCYLGIRIVAQNGMANGMHQMRFAEAGVAVEEKWIVGLRGRLGNRHGSGVRHMVVTADDKCFEGVARIERAGMGTTAFIITGSAGRGFRSGGRGLAGRLGGRGAGVGVVSVFLKFDGDHPP